MSVVVKTRPTKSRARVAGFLNMTFRRNTPQRVLRDIGKRYGRYIVHENHEDADLIEWKKTDLHKEISARMTPADRLRELRTITGQTMQVLGDKIGVTPQRVYEFETARRSIPKTAAKKLSAVFGVSPAAFI